MENLEKFLLDATNTLSVVIRGINTNPASAKASLRCIISICKAYLEELEVDQICDTYLEELEKEYPSD